MDKEQRRLKFLKEHPKFTYESLFGGIYGSIKQWRKNNPLKVKAHKKVFIEVRAGRLKKQKCFCGNKKTEAHHDNYLKPLDVKWLCKKHHIIADQNRRTFDKKDIHR